MSPVVPKTYRGAGRVAYLAIRVDVENKLAKGWCLTDIFAQYEARMPIGYKQFAKYVQRFSDNHKIRPYGWTPPVKATPPTKPYVPPPAPPKPKPPTYTSPSPSWTIEELFDGKPDRDLFS